MEEREVPKIIKRRDQQDANCMNFCRHELSFIFLGVDQVSALLFGIAELSLFKAVILQSSHCVYFFSVKVRPLFYYFPTSLSPPYIISNNIKV